MLGPFATASRITLSFTRCHYCRHCRTPPAHRCPRRRRRRRQRQRQRVTEGTAMAPWNGPKKFSNHNKNCQKNVSDPEDSLVTSSRPPGRPQKRPDNRTSNTGVAVRTAGDWLPADHRCWRRAMSEVRMQQSIMYCGALCCRHRWTVEHSLYCCTHWGTKEGRGDRAEFSWWGAWGPAHLGSLSGSGCCSGTSVPVSQTFLWVWSNVMLASHLAAVKTHEQCVTYRCKLSRDDRQDGHVDAVELVKTTPRAALTQPREDLTHRLTITDDHTTVNRQATSILYLN